MSFFAINFCNVSACQNWRIGDKCVKDQMCIQTYAQYAANIHDNSICQVRKQIDEYRLTVMLGE